MSRFLHLHWFRTTRAQVHITYDLDADLLEIGGDIVKTVRRLIPYSAVYTIHREAGIAEPAAGGTALAHRHLPAVSFFTTDHYTDPQESLDHD